MILCKEIGQRYCRCGKKKNYDRVRCIDCQFAGQRILARREPVGMFRRLEV